MERLRRLQDAEQRRLFLEEARRQKLAERGKQQEQEAERARMARERAEEMRDLQAQQRLQTLRARWTRADKQVTHIKQSAKKAAGDRVATWRVRRDAAAVVRLQPQSLFEHVRQHWGKVKRANADPSGDVLPKRRASRVHAPSWMHGSSPRVLPAAPQELLQYDSRSARFARALYDSQEDDGVVLRQLAAARKLSMHTEWLTSRGSARASFRARLRERNLHYGWSRWQELWSEMAQRRSSVQGILVRRMLNRKLWRSWQTWVQLVAGTQSAYEAMDRVIRYLLNRNLRRGWLGWHDAFVEATRRRAAMRGCLVRMMNRELSQSWQSWIQMVEAVLHTYEVMTNVLRTFLNRNLKRGLLGWIHVHREATHRREAMRHFVTLMLGRHLSRGWRGWHTAWQAIVETRSRVHTTIVRMKNQKLSRGWNAWAQMVGGARCRAEALQVMHRVTRYLINRSLRRGWLGWLSAYSGSVRGRDAARRCLLYMLRRELSRSWQSWTQLVAETQCVQEVMEHVIRTLFHRSLNRGWQSWLLAGRRVHHHHQAWELAVCRSRAYWMFESLRFGLSAWIDHHCKLRAARELAERRSDRLGKRASPRNTTLALPENLVELLDAKSCADARALRVKIDLFEERQVALRQDNLNRAAMQQAREAALMRMALKMGLLVGEDGVLHNYAK